jgi:alkanesulfonate monooxygenase SsuD/methylene tetrahydromethanopterin reductase-like flavin-dependent oxidoreductase (luciferase family)
MGGDGIGLGGTRPSSGRRIDILRKLWAGNNVSHKGRFYKFENLTIEPKPVQNPCPIWIANNPHIFGASEKLLNHIARRVARMADGWQTTFTTPEAFKLGWQRIEQQAKEIGRDVSKMPRCLYYNCHINEDRKAVLHESKEFLDAYYTTDFSEQQLTFGSRWGARRNVSRRFKPTSRPVPTSSVSASRLGISRGNLIAL